MATNYVGKSQGAVGKVRKRPPCDRYSVRFAMGQFPESGMEIP